MGVNEITVIYDGVRDSLNNLIYPGLELAVPFFSKKTVVPSGIKGEQECWLLYF